MLETRLQIEKSFVFLEEKNLEKKLFKTIFFSSDILSYLLLNWIRSREKLCFHLKWIEKAKKKSKKYVFWAFSTKIKTGCHILLTRAVFLDFRMHLQITFLGCCDSLLQNSPECDKRMP